MIYLSLGAGVQSSALYVLCTQGKAPRPDVAIFADVGDEPQFVHDQLARLKVWGEANGGPRIDVVSRGRLSQDIVDRHNGKRSRFAAIPAFTSDGNGGSSMLRRQCTREYKIEPIEKHVRTLLGLAPRQRAKGKVSATALIGISRDEVQRMKPSRTTWITNVYPLVDLGLRRADCVRVVQEAGLPRPLKSSCVFCPFHDNEYWTWLKTEHPDEFEKAAKFDEAFRDTSRSGDSRPVFLHRSLKALREVDFEDRQYDLFDGFGNDCTGTCGV